MPFAVLLFPLCWLAVLAILSVVSGWPRLAERFPVRAVRGIDERRFRFVSGSLGGRLLPVAFRSALVCGVSSDGLELSVLPFFRVFHPSMFIPWSAVEAVTYERHWFVMTTTLRLRESPAQIQLLGAAGDAVRETWDRLRTASV